MNLTDLKKKNAAELIELAQSIGIDSLARQRKQDMIFSILKEHSKQGEHIYGGGVCEILQDGYGFLRSADSSYQAGPDDVYVSPSQIRRFALRTGDTVFGRIRPPKEGERYFRAPEGRRDQPRPAAAGQEQGAVREPDAAARERALRHGARQRQHRGHHRPDHRLRRPHRQGPAGPDRVAAEGRQDDDHAEHRAVDRGQQPRRLPHGAPDRRAARGGHRDAAHGAGGRHLQHLRRARRPPRAGRRDGHREGQAPGRAQARTSSSCSTRSRAWRGPTTLSCTERRARMHVWRGRLERRCTGTEALLRRRPQHRGGRQPDDHRDVR